MKLRLVTGITPSGQLTIGNYLGAIKTLVSSQDKYEMYIFAANLHALTQISGEFYQRSSAKELKDRTLDIIALYLACGINPDKANIFIQSNNKDHTYLAYILQCTTTIGQLSRMTQYKNKTIKNKKITSIPTGLLIYPTLMAADILLYKPNFIPTGSDQKQHIELCRDIAQFINKNYKNIFPLPSDMISKQLFKIKSLVDPQKKMSKSDSDVNSFILLNDDPDIAYKKIIKAKTDSENKVYFDINNKKRISNLINIYCGLSDTTKEEVEEKYKEQGYKEFKEDLGKIVKSFLIQIQEKFCYYRKQEVLEKILIKGQNASKKITSQTIKEINEAIGL